MKSKSNGRAANGRKPQENPDENPAGLLRATMRHLRREGFPTGDPEYGSAVGWAVFQAIRCHRPGGGRKLIHLCILFAMRCCSNVRRDLQAKHRADLRGADRGLRQAPVARPLSMSDFELLCFVAAHKVAKAARLLGITAYHLKRILLDIQLKVREGVALADDPPTFGLGEIGDEDGEAPGMSYHVGGHRSSPLP